MGDTFLRDVKNILDGCIHELDEIRSLFCKNPISDFTRNRKLSFSEIINIMIKLQSKSLPNEMLDYFDHDVSTPTVSAFIQQREKILFEGWEYLLHRFIEEGYMLASPLYRGYRLLACDGSDINIFRNPNDPDTFIHEGERGYNAIHLNALYDLQAGTYCDIQMQGKKKLHERKALNTMIDRYSYDIPSIIIADRGYESFNVFAHCMRKNIHFLIRMKDVSSNGILSAYDLPSEEEFDTYIETILTRRHTKETISNPDTYTILAPGTDFDFLDSTNTTYPIRFRIVCFQVTGGKYVSVATTLPEEEFTLEEIKNLYRMRWGEETSFRELKYTIGLINFHSKRRDLIEQEVVARIILYNFCQMVTQHAAEELSKTESDTGKYRYKINFATTVNICRAYLKSGGDENDLLKLIQKHLSSIKCDAKYPLHLRPKRNRDFVYRAA